MEKKENVVYKVVDKNTRKSIVIARYSTTQEIVDAFALCYKPGSIVKAKRGSFGIFCFESYEAAKRFAQDFYVSTLVIKVKPVGSKKSTPSIVPNLRFYKLPELLLKVKRMKLGIYTGNMANWPVALGTVCYAAVEVLE